MHYTTTHVSGVNYFMTVVVFDLGESANSTLALLSLTPCFSVHRTMLNMMYKALIFETDCSLEYLVSLAINHLKLDPQYDA